MIKLCQRLVNYMAQKPALTTGIIIKLSKCH